MKIEVNLNDIFCDEDGIPSETMQESVERQVVSYLSKKLEGGIGKQIDAEVSRIISTKLQELADKMLPKLAEDMINAEYQTVGQYGHVGTPTTFRQELVKVVQRNLVYKKERYENDRNVFTKAVDGVISENMKLFKEDFNKLVSAELRKEALEYAIRSLKKSLGFKNKT